MQIEIDLTKLERGTHIGRVKVTRGGKTFYREQRIGLKESDVSEDGKSVMTPNNMESIKSFKDMGISGGIHTSDSYIVKFKDGTKAIHKVLDKKGITGETHYYKLTKILNWGICPETVSGDFGKGEGVCQEWIPDCKQPSITGRDEKIASLIDKKHFNDLSKIFVLDLIVASSDRNPGNVLIDKNDRCYAIDNEDWYAGMVTQRAMVGLDIECGEKQGRVHSSQLKFMESSKLTSEDYKLFKKYVIKNIKNVVDNKEKIRELYSKFAKINDNLIYMENYLNDNMEMI